MHEAVWFCFFLWNSSDPKLNWKVFLMAYISLIQKVRYTSHGTVSTAEKNRIKSCNFVPFSRWPIDCHVTFYQSLNYLEYLLSRHSDSLQMWKKTSFFKHSSRLFSPFPVSSTRPARNHKLIDWLINNKHDNKNYNQVFPRRMRTLILSR